MVSPCNNTGHIKHGSSVRLELAHTGTSISHGQEERPVVLELKVLVLELRTVDGFAAGAIALGEVTTLDHELLDHSVKGGSLVVQRPSGLANAFVSSTESAKVLGRLGHDVVEELEGDTPSILVTYLDVEKNAAAALLGLFRGSHRRLCGFCYSVWSGKLGRSSGTLGEVVAIWQCKFNELPKTQVNLEVNWGKESCQIA